MPKAIKPCGCDPDISPALAERLKRQVQEINEKIAANTYRSLDLASLSDEDFDLWCADRKALGDYDGFTISGLSSEKMLRALLGTPDRD